MRYEDVKRVIPEPEFKEVLIKKYQSTNDIIADLIYTFKKYKFQTNGVAENLHTGNIKNDSYEIWNFIRDEITYKAEPFKRQTTSSFSRIIFDKKGDCKHSALIVSSIGYQMGYNVIFRFVSYDNDKTLGHVYVILEDPTTKERIIIDPLQTFNDEKKFTKHKDYKALQINNNMTLSRLTGGLGATGQMMPDDEYLERDLSVINAVDFGSNRSITLTPLLSDATIDRIEDLEEEADFIEDEKLLVSPNDDDDEWEWVEEVINGKKSRRRKKKKRKAKRKTKKARRKAKKKVRKAKRKIKVRNFKKKVKKAGAKLKAGIKKVALAPVRGALMALLLLNFKGYATRLKQALENNPAKVEAFGKKFGFRQSNLRQKILKGAKKKAMFSGIGQTVEIEGIGIVVSAAAVATAAPAIIAIIALLKSLGIGQKGDEEDTSEAMDDIENYPDYEGEEAEYEAAEPFDDTSIKAYLKVTDELVAKGQDYGTYEQFVEKGGTKTYRTPSGTTTTKPKFDFEKVKKPLIVTGVIVAAAVAAKAAKII